MTNNNDEILHNMYLLGLYLEEDEKESFVETREESYVEDFDTFSIELEY